MKTSGSSIGLSLVPSSDDDDDDEQSSLRREDDEKKDRARFGQERIDE
jgi:hypothetical protein